MNYKEIDLEQIPKGATFYYISIKGDMIKCRKIDNRQTFSWKEGARTFKRYCRFPDNWYCMKAIKKGAQ